MERTRSASVKRTSSYATMHASLNLRLTAVARGDREQLCRRSARGGLTSMPDEPGHSVDPARRILVAGKRCPYKDELASALASLGNHVFAEHLRPAAVAEELARDEPDLVVVVAGPDRAAGLLLIDAARRLGRQPVVAAIERGDDEWINCRGVGRRFGGCRRPRPVRLARDRARSLRALCRVPKARGGVRAARRDRACEGNLDGQPTDRRRRCVRAAARPFTPHEPKARGDRRRSLEQS